MQRSYVGEKFHRISFVRICLVLNYLVYISSRLHLERRFVRSSINHLRYTFCSEIKPYEERKIKLATLTHYKLKHESNNILKALAANESALNAYANRTKMFYNLCICKASTSKVTAFSPSYDPLNLHRPIASDAIFN